MSDYYGINNQDYPLWYLFEEDMDDFDVSQSSYPSGWNPWIEADREVSRYEKENGITS